MQTGMLPLLGFVLDMLLVLKIFVLMTIISFVINHLGKGPVAIVVILGVAWFVLFDQFWFFGGVYVLMMMLMFGVSTILIDFFFVGAGMGGGGGAEPEKPISSGADVAARMAHAQRGRASLAQGMMRRFRGR